MFARDLQLIKSLAMFPLCGASFKNALGALAPPEVAVYLEWNGQIRANAAKCNMLSVAVSDPDTTAIPDWLVVDLNFPLWMEGDAPGNTLDATSLFEEGCAEVDPVRLLESWARHCLVWTNTWEGEGMQPLHREWCSLAYNMGNDITYKGMQGKFMGVDEDFGLLLRTSATTHLFPVANLLKESQ